ncbi:MAG: DUF1559 domain-containing protein [Planctomycetaceae bacterium]|nr:DUF1559 domain-containing protein [Planctomycetaceae bacterium]
MLALPRSRRAGFSLLELLTVLAVITVLLALLLPAIQRARSTARMLECRSRLHQIGIATHSYVEMFETFPSGGVGTLGCLYALLPYMDQASVFQRTEAIADLRAKMAAIPVIPAYLCPEDPTDKSNNVASYSTNKGLLRAVGQMRGFVFEPVKPADVTDGLSQTAFASEQITNTWRPSFILYEPSLPLRRSITEHRELARRCAASPGTVSPRGIGGGSPSVINLSGGYNHLLPPNSPACVFSDYPADVNSAVGGHPQGVNVLYADGSVRFTSNWIDGIAWWHLGTIDSGDLVTEFP